jgi:hypothetical protein
MNGNPTFKILKYLIKNGGESQHIDILPYFAKGLTTQGQRQKFKTNLKSMQNDGYIVYYTSVADLVSSFAVNGKQQMKPLEEIKVTAIIKDAGIKHYHFLREHPIYPVIKLNEPMTIINAVMIWFYKHRVIVITAGTTAVATLLIQKFFK